MSLTELLNLCIFHLSVKLTILLVIKLPSNSSCILLGYVRTNIFFPRFHCSHQLINFMLQVLFFKVDRYSDKAPAFLKLEASAMCS
jgi:hypothetical protein